MRNQLFNKLGSVNSAFLFEFFFTFRREYSFRRVAATNILIPLLIFIPVFIQSSFCSASETVGETEHRFSVSREIFFYDFAPMFSTLNFVDGGKEGVSKFFSGSVAKLNPSVSGISSIIDNDVKEFCCQCANNSACSKCDGWVKGYHANSLLLGFSIGGALAILVLDIFPRLF
jgi:hypothetical protein